MSEDFARDDQEKGVNMMNKSHRHPNSDRVPASIVATHEPEKSLNLKSILVPIDFSGCCRKALQYAVLLAKDYGASIVLAHIVDSKNSKGKRLKILDQELHAFARREIGDEAAVTTIVKCGDPLREIINLAEAGLIDLMIISTHARAGLPDFCMSSAAEQIVRYAPCPVLVVRQHEHDFLEAHKPSRDQ